MVGDENSFRSVVPVSRRVSTLGRADRYLTQGPNESVTLYVNRLRDIFNNLNRQVEKQNVQPSEALQIGIFERGLRPAIFEL